MLAWMNPKVLLGLSLVAMIAVGGFFVNEKYAADAEVTRLEMVVDGYEETIQIMRQAADQKQRALDTANAVRADLEEAARNYEDIQNDASSATEENDGEIAPILRRTLDALDGL